MICKEMDGSLRDRCCWERHCQTSRFAKIRFLHSEIVDEAAKQRLRVKEESYKAYIEEDTIAKNFDQARPWRHWAAGEWCWYWRSGKHTGSRKKSGEFLGPALVLPARYAENKSGERPDAVCTVDGEFKPRCGPRRDTSFSQNHHQCLTRHLTKRWHITLWCMTNRERLSEGSGDA